MRVPPAVRGMTLTVAGLAIAATSHAQEWPETRAERSGYLETSRYGDVVDFLADAGLGVWQTLD